MKRGGIMLGIPPAHCVRGGMVRPARKVQREKMGGGVWGQLRLAVVDMHLRGRRCLLGRRPSFPLSFSCTMHHSA